MFTINSCGIFLLNHVNSSSTPLLSLMEKAGVVRLLILLY